MNESPWLRAAAVTASLAGLSADDAVRGFAADDAAVLRHVMASFREAGDRAGVARSIVRARLEVATQRGSAEVPEDPDAAARGAVIVASVLRGLAPPERQAWSRGFDAASLRAVGAASQSSARIETASWLRVIRRMGRVRGRMPSLAEIGAVLGGSGHATLEQDRRAMRIAGLSPAKGAG